MENLPISLVIPTMNRPKTLNDTLRHFFSGSKIPSELIVIDQSNNISFREKNKRIVEKYSSFCVTKYIYQKEPSLTKARNTGFHYVTEEVVLYSDDDVVVKEDTLFNLFTLMSDKKVAMIGGVDENSQSSRNWLGYILGTKSYIHRHIGYVTKSILGRFPDQFKERVPTMWTMGFFFCIRKSLKEEWNVQWDENLPGYAYAEDLDFSYSYYKKAKEKGLTCIFSNKITVLHNVSTEYRIPSRVHTFMYVLNRAYLCEKHHFGIRGTFAMCWCNFWIFIERLIKRQKPKDMLDAIKYYFMHSELVKNGKFPY